MVHRELRLRGGGSRAASTGPAPAACTFCEYLKWLLGRRRRYEVEGASMAPTLFAGDVVLCDPKSYRRRLPAPGEIVLARDPRAPGRTIIKRIAALDPQGRLELRGDAPAASTDSRHFGLIDPGLVLGRVTCLLHRGR